MGGEEKGGMEGKESERKGRKEWKGKGGRRGEGRAGIKEGWERKGRMGLRRDVRGREGWDWEKVMGEGKG